MVLTSLSITLITMLTFSLSLAIKPTIKFRKFELQLFWIIPLIGAFFLIIFGVVPVALDRPESLFYALTSSARINPIQILILFISVSILSIVLDEAGFFKWMANYALQKAGTSQKRIFFSLYITISILTIFTSNDIVILTFTPFIAYFAKRARINPLPYLIMNFIAANTWSVLLVIGNPTNIFLATSYAISFFDYFLTMVLPTVVLSLTALAMTYFLFRKSINLPIQAEKEPIQISLSKTLMIVGLFHLFGCTFLLSISNLIQVEMWLICMLFAISMTIFTLVYSLVRKKNVIGRVYARTPWNLIPFVLSMFTIVYGLELTGISSSIGRFLESTSFSSPLLTVFQYGFLSTFSANVLNNIPMSVAFSTIITSSSMVNQALFATIIGSNLGAILTPVGALAGIMWMAILKKENISLSFIEFFKYGILILLPSLILGLFTLYLVL